MAELFPSNYAHPDYASPEQLAQQRAYANELLKGSAEKANRPAGAIGNMIQALTSNLERNRANQIQSQAAGQNAQDQSALIAQLQGGQKADPNNLGAILANPMASPETRALAVHLLTMRPKEDVAGRPANESPATGVVAAPITGAFQPGYRTPESAGNVSTTSPVAAPPFPGATPSPMTPTNPQGGAFGGMNFKPAGWDGPPSPAPPAPAGGPTAPGPALPAGPAPAASVGSRIDALAAKDRELTAERERTQGGAKAEAGVIGQDIAAANDAPNVLKGVGTIKDNIQRYGDKITFGPTSPWSLEMKRVAANYAPGLMKDHLESIAAADSINKVGIGLAGVLASQLQGGNNAETFAKSMQGVPGLTTSKEGALAMADMIQQSAMKSQQLGGLYRQLEATGRLRDYQAAREKFMTDHPVVNPLTKRPIEMDIQAVRDAAGKSGAGGGPPVGAIHNGYRFKGGNPNDKANWEPVT